VLVDGQDSVTLYVINGGNETQVARWTNSVLSAQQTEVDLSAFSSQTIQIKFLFQSEKMPSALRLANGGWRIDNVRVLGETQSQIVVSATQSYWVNRDEDLPGVDLSGAFSFRLIAGGRPVFERVAVISGSQTPWSVDGTGWGRACWPDPGSTCKYILPFEPPYYAWAGWIEWVGSTDMEGTYRTTASGIYRPANVLTTAPFVGQFVGSKVATGRCTNVDVGYAIYVGDFVQYESGFRRFCS